MTITIYDYANREIKVELPDKEILRICVTVLSGDETGWVEFADGSRINFDASDCRISSYYDGTYIVEGDNIEKWLNFVPSESTASYERQENFY